jgi:putative transposase
MRIKNLNKKEKEKIEKAYKTTKNVNEKVRYQALSLLVKEYQRKDVAEIVGFSEKTLGLWVTAYNKRGIEGLREKRTTGNRRKLTNDQKDGIAKIIKVETPDTRGFQGKFWTVQTLKQLVKKEYGVTYKDSQSYRTLFSYAGFSFHKPEKVNKNRNQHMRKRFEQNIKKNSKNTGEKIAWYW